MMLRTTLAFCLILLGCSTAHAQLSVSVVPTGGAQIDARSVYPDVQMRLRVTKDGQPFGLGAGDVVILEGNIPVVPRSVTPNGDGTHLVRWRLSRQNGQATPDDVNTIFVTRGSETVSTTAIYNRNDFPSFRVLDSMGKALPRTIDFGRVPAGTQVTGKYRVYPFTAPREGVPPEERRVLLESIETRSGQIQVVWRSSFIDRVNELPALVLSPIEYRFDLIYTPVNDEPLVDTLIVTYEGGMTERMVILANQRAYQRLPRLVLQSPNGGEAFAPCQDIDIRWTGSLKGFYTYVDYTTDDGITWNRIDSTLDTTMRWTVPETLTERARIAVYQQYDAAKPVWLRGEASAATNVAVSGDGTRAAVAYRNGVIQEWDIITLQPTAKYQANPSSVIVGLAYQGKTFNILAAINRNTSVDAVQRFVPGKTTPDASVDLPAGFEIRDLGIDPRGERVYVYPQFGPRIPVRDATTLQEITNLDFSQAVTAAVINGDELVVALLDGTVQRWRIPETSFVGTFNSGINRLRGPMIARVALAPSRRFIALAGQTSPASFSPRDQLTYIFDLQRGELIRLLQSQAGTEMANMVFSASDAYLMLGYRATPQLQVFDIEAQKRLLGEGTAFQGLMQDMEFAPDGSRLMTCSNDPVIGRNTLLQNFATPERDSCDAVFTIARPDIDVKELVLKPMLVGDSSTVNASVNLCNVGRVPWIVDSTILRGATWIRFNDSLRGDTLKPGACVTLRFAALPLDTGQLTDALDVIACNDTVSLPIQVQVSDRKLPMLADGTDFGNVCVGQFSRRRVQVLRNDDPIPVVINAVFSERGLLSQFRVVNFPANTIVQPGATLEADLEFAPTAIGADTAMIVVRYAGSTTVRKRFSVLGVGKGAVINTSHNVLPFVPEIVEREVTLTNASDITVTVVSATLTAGAPFTVLTALPADIRAGDSIRIGLRYNGGTIPADAALTFAFDPCAVARTVQLGTYRGQAVVSIPDVSADPRGDAAIPINVDVTEPIPYAGVRSLEGAFTVNPRLFLARSVAVEGGEGVVLSQDVVNDRRVVRYRITRRFEKSGTVGTIIGWAGLAEVDSSALTVDTSAPNFGSAVTTTGRNGLLRILNPDPQRRVVDRPLPVIRIAPNPVDDRASVTISATQSATASFRIVDAQGRLVRTLPPVSIRRGEQTVEVAVDDLLPGVYTVILTSESGTTSSTMVVL